VSVEVEARLFGKNDRIRFLEAEIEKEEELEKKEEDLEKKAKDLKQELIITQLKHELREEKER
ncbi:hypothetical protein KI387_004075, partial [Taxus chinensis]